GLRRRSGAPLRTARHQVCPPRPQHRPRRRRGLDPQRRTIQGGRVAAGL
ncbi:MAG: Aspartate-semialdehyde dehydrogenase, partial [uncultured Thermomicrobiales bacterium]